MGDIYIIGHKNPDTDSVVSAIAYADLKRQLGFKNVVPARAGVLNRQTAFILKQLNVKPPILIQDVRIKVKDIMMKNVITVNENEPLLNAFKKFKKYSIRFLPVVNKDFIPVGLLTLSIVTDNFLKYLVSTKIITTIKNIKKSLKAKELNVVNINPAKQFKGQILLTTGSKEVFKKAILNSQFPGIIISDDRIYLLESVLKFKDKIKLIIFSAGNKPPEEFIKKATRNNILCLYADYDATQITFALKQSIPVIHICSKDFRTISPDALMGEAKAIIERERRKGVIVINDENRIIGVVTRSLFLTKPDKKVILVDHNEPSQAVDGIDEVEILEIVDHHRISPLTTEKPITFINYPVGSTSTIIAMLYKNNNIKPDKKIATLLIAGILSDTVILKSPTTTSLDKEMVKWLNQFAQINYKKFAFSFFKEGSKIDFRKIDKVILSDFKEFIINENKIGIGQIEVVGFNEFLRHKDKFYVNLKKIQQEREYKLLAFMVTDITQQSSLLLISAPEDIIARIPYNKIGKNLFELKGIISRKKQVLPFLTRILSD